MIAVDPHAHTGRSSSAWPCGGFNKSALVQNRETYSGMSIALIQTILRFSFPNISSEIALGISPGRLGIALGYGLAVWWFQ